VSLCVFVLFQTAHLSPSSFGFEPWHYCSSRSALRELIKPVAGSSFKIRYCKSFLLGLSMKAPGKARFSIYFVYDEGCKKMPADVIEMYSKFYREFQESDFDLDTDKKLFDWSAKQTYIALGNMMTSAALVGIDSCPMGFIKKKAEALLREKFDVDTEYGLSFMVAFGYRKADPANPKSRRKIEDIVTWK
jgi:nitroreductase